MAENFKTTQGKFLFNKNNVRKLKKFIPRTQTKKSLVTDFLCQECSENDLIESIRHPLSNKKLIKYIIMHSCTNCIDKIMTSDDNLIDYIKRMICKHTDNIELYEKYNTKNGSLYYDLCYSLFYLKKPSQLTNHILNNYDCSTKNNDFNMFCSLKDSNTMFFLIKYIIETLHIGYAFSIYGLCYCMPENLYFEILNMLVLNTDDFYACPKTNLNLLRTLMGDIVCKLSLPNIKIFMSTHPQFINQKICIEAIPLCSNLDIFLFMIELVGVNKINSKLFDHYDNFCECYDIVKWLIDNEYLRGPECKINFHIDEISDDSVIDLIINNAIELGDFDYIEKNSMALVFSIMSGGSLELFNKIPISIFKSNSDQIFELLLFDEKFDLLYLFDDLSRPTNIDDIVHDCKLLNKNNILNYISENSEYFYDKN